MEMQRCWYCSLLAPETHGLTVIHKDTLTHPTHFGGVLVGAGKDWKNHCFVGLGLQSANECVGVIF